MEFWIILNSPELAIYCLENGVNRIFLDLEKIGKIERERIFRIYSINEQNKNSFDTDENGI